MVKNFFCLPQWCLISALFLLFCNRSENPSDTQNSYSLKVSADSCGSVIDSGVHNIAEGGGYELIAGKPLQGYSFAYWSVQIGEEHLTIQNRDSCRANVVNVQGNAEVKAIFKKSEYTFSYTILPAHSMDSVILDPEPKTDGFYDYGTEVKVRLVPVAGWKVSRWNRIAKANTDSAVVTIVGSISDTIECDVKHVPENVICVKWDAPQNGGGITGSSWVDAFTNLSMALAEMGKNLEKDTIWVAHGTYRVAGFSEPFTIPRTNVAVVGGFSGTEETSNERDSLRAKTALDAVIDTLTKGSAVISVPAGSDNVLLSTLTIQNAVGGAAVSGGINAANSNNCTIFRCVVNSNSPYGIRAGNKTVIKQCAVIDNKGTSGAGIIIMKDSVLVLQSLIANNSATGNGAGIYLTTTSARGIIIGSDIVYNSANGSNLTAGIYKADNGSAATYIANSIIWGNVVTQSPFYGDQINIADTIINSIVQEPVAGKGIGAIVGNSYLASVTSSDPYFKDKDKLSGADNVWFNNDDGLIPESDSLIDRASAITGHPEWNPICDIRNIPISRTGGKSYDIGAYDQ